MFRFRGRTFPFWFARLVGMWREGELVAALIMMLVIGLAIGLIIGLVGGIYLGTTIKTASDFWISS